jgi:hypothetical protein
MTQPEPKKLREYALEFAMAQPYACDSPDDECNVETANLYLAALQSEPVEELVQAIRDYRSAYNENHQADLMRKHLFQALARWESRK